jgi:hypothetical protein
MEPSKQAAMSSRWRSTSPHELMGWLAAVEVPWGIAGGWALDLWHGTVTREHSDIEIACFRTDLHRLLPALDAFEIAIAQNKALTPYRIGEALPDRHFSLWLRRRGEVLWDFEIVAESQRGVLWTYRREPQVARPLDQLFTRAGVFPTVRAEIQLLYKCKEPRPRDIDDLERFVPMLDDTSYSWLCDAVDAAHPQFRAKLEGFRRA